MMPRRFGCLSLLILASPLVQAQDYEPAQCYWAPNEELPFEDKVTTNSYIPCGDSGQGAQPCCRVGHTCLEENACYGPEAGMVYTAGCTDSEYESSRCPSKCGRDAYWVGHSYCNGTSNEWSCCPNQYGDTENEELYPFRNGEMCWCPEDDAEIAFAAPSKIADVVYLDLDNPGEISYFPGQTSSPDSDSGSSASSADASPTGASQDDERDGEQDDEQDDEQVDGSQKNADGSQADGSSGSPSGTRTRSSDSAAASGEGSAGARDSAASPDDGSDRESTSTSSSSSSSSSLSTGDKIGIGVGAGVGAILLAALIAFLFYRRGKARRLDPPPIQDQIRPKSFNGYSTNTDPYHSPEGPNGDPRKPMWAGHKSELPADANGVVPPMVMADGPRSSSVAEVEATTPRVSSQSQAPYRSSGNSQGENPMERQWQSTYDENGIRRYEPYHPTPAQAVGPVHEMPGSA